MAAPTTGSAPRPAPLPALPESTPASAVVANREEPSNEWYAWSGHDRQGEESRGVTRILWRGRQAAALRRAAVGARVAETVLCLVAFSVLAADHRKGWALDSYYHYSQFRYCVSVNVIGFVYAGFQVYAEFHHMMKKKHIIDRPVGNYFDFAMDQILAYLLISASSSATARIADWVSNWGTDPFPNMANGSVAVSFLAFLAFAFSSLISAYNLFNRNI
ncbi:CASP-like protein 4A2 [Elaeis guineensis]|uniref:CASP-like protein n=1 Tax=Elaeis guineensis var. tenera TaxID=51953 RepID=A0A6I9SBL9_ELAGV|nr:CASP-like protein 4A2 [Elaeis guineensis]